VTRRWRENGLQRVSQVMIDQAATARREKIGPTLGRVESGTLLEVARCLAVCLGIAWRQPACTP
jgi:mRNA interferase MazF